MIVPLHALSVPSGGKVDGCARLLQAGFPVPEGLVVDADAPPAEISAALQAWPPDARFAVRSSALDEDGLDHSFAGAHETLLDVAADAVPAAVARCAASLYAPRAVAYRVQHHLPTHDLRMTVLVQRMIAPRVAGVAFTSDPFGPSHEMLVNAAWGHGEAVVSGWVEPDEIRLDRESGAVRSVRVGAKRQRVACRDGHTVVMETAVADRGRLCLSPAHLRELAALLRAVHRLFGAPRDVEWCHDGERFWVLQARPLTARRLERPREPIEWTRANLVEVLPDVGSPQAVEANVRLIDVAMRGWYGALLGPDSLGPCATRICGRPWFNLSRLRALCRATATDVATVLQGMGHTRPLESTDPPTDRLALVRNLPALARMAARQAWVSARLPAWFARLDRVVWRLSAVDPATVDDLALAAELRRYEALSVSSMRRTYALGGMTAWRMLLERVLARAGVDPEPFLHALLAAAEPTVTSQQGLDLLALASQARREPRVRSWFRAVHRREQWHKLARWRQWLGGSAFCRAFQAFLARHGHRGPYESDWSVPRFSDDPVPLLFAVARLVAAPDEGSALARRSRLAEAAAARWAAVAPRLSPLTRRLVSWLLGRVRAMYALRERNRAEFVRVEATLRRWHQAVADRLVARGWLQAADDYFLLYLPEVIELLEGRLDARAVAARVARRSREQAAWRALRLPLHGTSADVAEHLLAQGSPAGTRHPEQITPADAWPQGPVRGLCLSPGLAEGEVVVIESPHDFARMRRGAVLVAPAVDPAWVPLFTLAAAVVVEVGGTLSHAATVAREYGLPAIAGIPRATRFLRDGERVRVDATRGLLERVDSTESPAPPSRRRVGG